MRLLVEHITVLLGCHTVGCVHVLEYLGGGGVLCLRAPISKYACVFTCMLIYHATDMCCSGELVLNQQIKCLGCHISGSVCACCVCVHVVYMQVVFICVCMCVCVLQNV